MITKYRTRFSLINSGKDSEEKQIFLVVTIESKEVFYYSGYRIHPDNFIKEKVTLSKTTIYVQQAKKNTFNKAGNSASQINARLKELENASLIIFEREYKGKDIEFNKDYFKVCLQKELGEYQEVKSEGYEDISADFFDCYDKYKTLTNVTKRVRDHRQADINRLKKYEATTKKEITFSNLDIDDFKKHISKGRATNTVVTIMKRLRSFYNYSKGKLKVITVSPFDNLDFSKEIGAEIYSEPICMTRDELTQLYASDGLGTDYNKLISDMFCLQASFGCRVSDFLRLTYNNIQDGMLIYYPSKTSSGESGSMIKVVVPISARANNIINKYKGHSKGDLIMPFVDSVEYNEQIKIVFKIAGLDRVVVRYDRDKKKEVYSKLYEIASSHLARRTFVDILCQAGEPIHVVASMSGHSENSKAFDRYRRRPEQLQIKAVSRSMD